MIIIINVIFNLYMCRLNTSHQLLSKHVNVRKRLNFLFNEHVTSYSAKTYQYRFMFGSYLSYFLKKHINTSQLHFITLKKKTIKNIRHKDKNNLLLLKKMHGTSNTVQSFYSFFFWNFYHNAINSMFKNKKITIANLNNKATKSSRNFSHPLNRIYVKSYKSLVNKEPFNLAKPVLSYLLKTSNYKSNPNGKLLNDRHCLFILMYYLLDHAVVSANHRQFHKTITYRPNKHFTTKISKSIYTINQYLLNSLLR